MIQAGAFAVILCNFTDSPVPQPFTRTAVINGWHTVQNYWSYSSYGVASLEGSQVFDWITLPLTNGAFRSKFSSTDSNGNTHNDREGMIEYAKKASGVAAAQYVGFIILFSESVGDAWTAGNGAIFDPTIMSAMFVCHEMTHILGELDHSYDFSGRADRGNPGEYYDQTDIMSAGNCDHTPIDNTIPFNGEGPYHCMVWKDQFGWLLPAAVQRISDADLRLDYDQTFTVCARSFETGQGPVCINFRDGYVEFATPTQSDAGLPNSGLLIHRRVPLPGKTYDVPYVVVKSLTAANQDQKFWFPGDVCTFPQDNDDIGPSVKVWFVSMQSGLATVNISTSPVLPLTEVQVHAIRTLRSTAGGGDGFDYIEWVGVSGPDGSLVPIVRDDVIRWTSNGRNLFYVVGADGRRANVVVESHYIKTAPDGDKSDNLLSLPKF